MEGQISLVIVQALGRLFDRMDGTAFILIPEDLFSACVNNRNSNDAKKTMQFYGLSKWLITLSKQQPEQALEMALYYVRSVKENGESIFDHDGQYPRLLTCLVREAEETEVSDGGAMLRKVLELQDLLAGVGIEGIEEWLSVAERQ
jgi:hypothetical protein